MAHDWWWHNRNRLWAWEKRATKTKSKREKTVNEDQESWCRRKRLLQAVVLVCGLDGPCCYEWSILAHSRVRQNGPKWIHEWERWLPLAASRGLEGRTLEEVEDSVKQCAHPLRYQLICAQVMHQSSKKPSSTKMRGLGRTSRWGRGHCSCCRSLFKGAQAVPSACLTKRVPRSWFVLQQQFLIFCSTCLACLDAPSCSHHLSNMSVNTAADQCRGVVQFHELCFQRYDWLTR